MLKLQKPQDLRQYTGVDPTRVNELHLLGFIPEYLYKNVMYFRTTDTLTAYLTDGTKPQNPKAKLSEVVKKVPVGLVMPTEETQTKKKDKSKEKEVSEPKEEVKEN